MSPTIDPSKLKVTELREELQARGLDTKGNKPVLVKRLKKALDDELNKGLPNTSKRDTSGEDLDSSRTEEADAKDAETEPEPEQESETSNLKDNDSSVQENVDESVVSETTEVCDTDAKTNGEKDTSKTEASENKQETDEVIEEETGSENKDEEMKEETSTQNQKGEKRKRTEDTDEVPKKKVFKITEDEPEIDSSKVLLSWYDSDLHLVVDKESFLSAKPLCDGLFGYAWAGVRATHGVSSGKVYYEVKLTEEMAWVDYVNQRKERNERSRDKRGKQKQNGASKKTEKESKTEPDEKKESDSDKTQEEKMEVTETAENTADTNIEKETSDETKMDTTEAGAESSPAKEDEAETPSESKEEKTEESAEVEKEAVAEGEDKETSDNKEESSETPNDQKEEAPEEPKKEVPVVTHLFRVGWSCQTSNLQLGEDDFSYGYESTGKFVSNKEFKDFAVTYKKDDVVGAYLDISTDKVEMRFTVNGELQPEVISIPRSELPEEDFAFFPHILSRNFGFELNLGTKEEPWFPSPESLEDYSFVQDVEEKVPGPVRPEKREECEVILMCGLPGSGKTHWVNEHLKNSDDKPINVIGATNLLSKMTVHGEPLKSSYKGPWNILMEKLQRCLNRLGDLAAQRRRNYVLDQTHVFPTVQQRKLRAFEGFKRRAVVIVVGDEEYAKRQAQKEAAVGKDVQEHTYMEMKANMSLPTQGEFCDEVIYADLNAEEAKAKVSEYNTEGKKYVEQKKKNKDNKGRFNRGYNNAYTQRRGNYRDNWGPQRYDRGPRGWGQLPPPGRNPRDRRSLPAPMPAGRPGWARNERGPPRPVHDRTPREGRPNYNRNRGGGRQNWQGDYGQGRWGGQQGDWGYGNQGWGSNNYQQGGGNWDAQGQWKYNQGYNQQGYGQNYDYYGQYPQNWSGQAQQSVGGSNQYAQWAHYAQQYAQGQNAKYTNAASKK